MTTRLRTYLFCSISVSACLAGRPALAQDVVADPPSAVAPESAEDAEIVVTGSRLHSANQTSSQPIVGISDEEFSRSGAVTASDMVNELPQFGNSFGAANQDISVANRGFNVGTELVNLRGLGTQRTLVLVNGRRHVGGDPGTSSVDMNTIPSGFIDRIEVVTGANSAVYGADAVSGVVNVIYRNRYEGTVATARAGISEQGDAAEYAATLLHGGSLGERFNFLVAAEYSNREGFIGRDRDWVVGDGSGSAYTMGAGSSAVDGGRFFTTGPTGTWTYPALGGTAPSPVTAATPSYQRVLDRNLQVPVERGLVSAILNYDLSPDHRLFVEATFARSQARLEYEPSFFQFRSGTLVSAFDLGPIPTTAPGRAAFLAATGATNINPASVHSRRFSEYGPRYSIIDRDLYRAAIGSTGEIGRFNYQVYYQYGRVETQQEDTPSVDKNRFYAGMNNCAGQYALPGCVPINVFGNQNLSQAAIDWTIIPDVTSRITSDQHVVSGHLAGELVTILGSPLSIVLGAEYRDESTRSTVHPSLQDGSNATRQIAASSGGASVKEVFGELRLPLFDGLFEIGGAGRVSDYSTVGTEFTWNVNGIFRPASFIHFRGSYGHATRAPDVRELFSPVGSANSTIVDPCANDVSPQDGVADAGRTVPAGCTTQLGANYLVTMPAAGSPASNITGGNPDLGSETARTFSVGAVVTAPSLLNFVGSVDYYDIQLGDVIGQLSPVQVVRECYVNQPNLPDIYCSLIGRQATGSRNITAVRTQLFNIADERVRGIDAQARISWPMFSGRMGLGVNYAYLIERSRREFAGGAVDDYTGRFDANRHQVRTSLTYSDDRFELSYQTQILGAALKGTSAANLLAVDDPNQPGDNSNRIGVYVYHDVQASINAGENYTFTLGVKNLTDREPPLITAFSNSGLSGSASVTAGGIYDVRGRFFYTRATIRF
jgi:iron complex outermembrane receptor protein